MSCASRRFHTVLPPSLAPRRWDQQLHLWSETVFPFEQINNTTGKVQYLHHDQQGSTRLITGSTGTVEGKCSYSAYGTPTCEGAATTPLGYDAQYTSTDTGLIYMRTREYDPATAQFLSVDPLVATTRAPYSYADDNPLRYRDRSGLGWEEALEGPGIPSPWGELEHASEELLRPGVEEVEHGAETYGTRSTKVKKPPMKVNRRFGKTANEKRQNAVRNLRGKEKNC
jgi:RHS repeat-associated protein